MDFFNSICVSPVNRSSNKRCSVSTTSYSLFCKRHSLLFRNKYLKYKRIEAHIKLDLVSEDVYSLLSCYSQLEKAYNLRYTFRRQAFVPETWDEGHAFKMEKMLKNMSSIVSRLEILFDQSLSRVSTDTLNSEEKSNTKSKVYHEIDFVKKKHTKIIQQKEDDDVIINEFLKKDADNKAKSCKLYELADKELQKRLGVKYLPNILVVSDLIHYASTLVKFNTIVTVMSIKEEHILTWKESIFFDKNIMKIYKQSYKNILKGDISNIYSCVHVHLTKTTAKTINFCIFQVLKTCIFVFKNTWMCTEQTISVKLKTMMIKIAKNIEKCTYIKKYGHNQIFIDCLLEQKVHRLDMFIPDDDYEMILESILFDLSLRRSDGEKSKEILIKYLKKEKNKFEKKNNGKANNINMSLFTHCIQKVKDRAKEKNVSINEILLDVLGLKDQRIIGPIRLDMHHSRKNVNLRLK